MIGNTRSLRLEHHLSMLLSSMFTRHFNYTENSLAREMARAKSRLFHQTQNSDQFCQNVYHTSNPSQSILEK